jgi:CheY-like chemotaxis protein
VLVAEDNDVNRKVLGLLLKRAGFRFDLAADGQEALDLFKSRKYDLVLLDLQMPVLNGFEAARAIRVVEGDGRHTPVIALTGNALDIDDMEIAKAGIDGVMGKPFDPMKLTEHMKRWLDRDYGGIAADRR